jgi:hypothetical protein
VTVRVRDHALDVLVRAHQLFQMSADHALARLATPLQRCGVGVRHHEIGIDVRHQHRNRIECQLVEIACLTHLTLGRDAVGDVLESPAQTDDLVVAPLALDYHAHPELAPVRQQHSSFGVCQLTRLLHFVDSLHDPLAIVRVEELHHVIRAHALPQRQLLRDEAHVGPSEFGGLDVIFPAADACRALHVTHQRVETHTFGHIAEREHRARCTAAAGRPDGDHPVFDGTALSVLASENGAHFTRDVG